MKIYKNTEVEGIKNRFVPLEGSKAHYEITDIWRTYNNNKQLIQIRYVLEAVKGKDKIVGVTQKDLKKRYRKIGTN